MNLGKITAQLSLNTAQFTKNAQQALKLLGRIADNLQRNFGGANRNILNSTNATRHLNKTLRDTEYIVSGILISQAFYQGAQAIRNATMDLGSFINELDRAQIALEYFLGGPKSASLFLLNMKDFAADTAFNTAQALTLSRKLMAAQFKPQEVRNVMEILNDAAVVGGGTAEQMDRIVLAMAQIKSAGRIMGSEIRQLYEANIPIYQILQEELKLTGEELKNIGDLHVPADVAIAGILRGLEKRYKGAADRIADTMGGMLDNIKDNTRFIGAELFDAPYRAIERYTTRVRDRMDELRHIMTLRGIGGVFEEVIPDELHGKIRAILGSLRSLAKSFRTLLNAIKPVAALIGGTLVNVFSTVLPPIAAIANGISNLIRVLFESSPAVRGFAAAIGLLLIASAAATALSLLWRIARLGVICAYVAKTVVALARAIALLTAVMSKNKLLALILVVAGALLYLASTSEIARRALSWLSSEVEGLTGVDFGDIFKPIDNSGIFEAIDKFNKQIDLSSDGIENIGKNADKAAKKIKDKFLASFDEVYQIPEELDHLGNVLDDLPEFNPPIDDLDFDFDTDIPEIKIPVEIPDFDKLFEDLWLIPARYNNNPPTIDPPNTNPFKEAIKRMSESVQNSLADAKVRIADFKSSLENLNNVNVAVTIRTLFQSIPGIIADSIPAIVAEFAGMFPKFVLETVIGMPLVAIAFSTAMGSLPIIVRDAIPNIVDEFLNIFKRLESETLSGMPLVKIAFSIAMSSFPQVIIDAVPAIVAEWKEMLDKLRNETVNGMKNVALNFGIGVAALPIAISNGIPTLTEAWRKYIDSLKTRLPANFAPVVASFVVEIAKIPQAINDARPQLKDQWDRSFNMLKEAVPIAFAGILQNFNNGMNTLTNAVNNNRPSMVGEFNATFDSIKKSIPVWMAPIAAEFLKGLTITERHVVDERPKLLDQWKQTFDGIKADTILYMAAVGFNTGKGLQDIKTSFNNWSNTWLKDWKEKLWNPTKKEQEKSLEDMTRAQVFWNADTETHQRAFANSFNKMFNAEMWDRLSKDAKQMLEVEIPNYWEKNKGAIIAIVGLMIPGIGGVLGRNGTLLKSMRTWFDDIFTTTEGWWGKWVSGLAGNLNNMLANATRSLADVTATVTSRVSELMSRIAGVNSASSGLPISGFATGGIIDEDSIIRVGERGKREAIVPLENGNYMRPFSQAVASDLAEMMGGSVYSRQSEEIRPILYVANLIADDRGLRELYRRMEVIGIEEQQRRE